MEIAEFPLSVILCVCVEICRLLYTSHCSSVLWVFLNLSIFPGVFLLLSCFFYILFHFTVLWKKGFYRRKVKNVSN